jgi:hypothetical protein
VSQFDLRTIFIDKDLNETIKALDEHDTKTMNADLIITENIEISGKPCNLGPDLLRDIELLAAYDLSSKTVFASIDKTVTSGGKKYLEAIVSNPIYDTQTLDSRSRSIQDIAKILPDLVDHLDALRKFEKDIVWIYESDENELKQLWEIVYFTTWFVRPLNNHHKVLTSYNVYRMLISPAIGIVSPLVYVIIPYIILISKLGIKLSFFGYVKFLLSTLMSTENMFLPASLSKLKYLSMIFSIIFYFQGIFNAVELGKAVHHICSLITNRVNGFVEFVRNGKALYSKCHDQIASFFDCQKLKIDSLESFDSYNVLPFSVFQNFGKQLALFKQIKKEDYKPLLNFAYMIDAIASIAKLSKLGYAAAIFNGGIKPYLYCQDGKHPCIINNPIANTITIGGDDHVNNMIITGPNAGGKSTIIKMLLVNVILAQTLTIACGEMTLVPFYLIKSQINIPDCKGKESLFEAEMYRSKANLDALVSLDDNHTALIVMDEIFNSTNPVEGIAGAYAIAKRMAMYPNAVSILTTHYLYLTKLAKDVENTFVNYRMNVIIDKDTDTITYPYKMSKGISRQYIALELLKQNGFDESIITDAMAIKMKFTSPCVVKQA